MQEGAPPPTLEEWLKRHPLGTDAFLDKAVAIAETLERIHNWGILRRDVSPVTIVIGADARPAFLPREGTRGDAAAGRLLAYSAPEQTGRMNRPVDRRADLYALGATYYRMLTGTPPFSVSDPIELAHAHVARPPVPPCQVNPAVPIAVSGIVLKLLAKMPEERYQTAGALIADLHEARRRLEASGSIEPFELGLLDLQQQLPLPERLYGRERETAEVRAAFDEACASGPRVLLVSGVAGIGKSALVQALRSYVTATESRGRFFQGKADLRSGNTPYGPFTDAFRQLVLDLLEQRADERAATRDRLNRALGTEGQVILDLVPELAQLVGEQPPLPELGPAQTANRFYLTVSAFVTALASCEHPLVLFIDDLHRADLASLRLLRFLANAPDLGPVLLVGAYRPVPATHALAETIAAMRSASARTHTIELGPLDAASFRAICCETLRCSHDRGDPLGELVHRKTAGNPFFLMRLLRFLHQSGLVSWSTTESQWDWDLTRIEQVRVTENVVDLLIDGLRRLPQTTRDALEVAACIGNTFSLELLARVQGESVDATAGRLWAAIREGLVQPLEASPSALEHGAQYKFAHDRVQQAAYSLLDEDKSSAIHLRAGRVLLEGVAGEEASTALFRAVDQLDLGAHLLPTWDERLKLVQLNLRAGRRARASSAAGPALGYLRRAIALLPGDAWNSYHDLAFVLHRDAAECAHFAGEAATGDELLDVASRHATSMLERAILCNAHVVASTLRSEYPEAIRWGREGLRLFGLDLPEKGIAEMVLEEVQTAQTSLRGRPIDDLLDAPAMRSEDHLACARILSNLFAPTYIARQDLYPLVVTRMANLSLSHGNTPESSFAFAAFGVILASMTDDYAMGHALGRLGVELSRRLGNPVHRCRAIGLFGAFMNHWREPIASSAPLLREAIATGTRSGELQYATYWGTSLVKNLFHRGVDLAQVLAETESVMERGHRHGLHAGVDWQVPYRQAIRCLQGQTRQQNGFDDAEFAERDYLASMADDPLATGLYHVRRLETSYLFGEYDRAIKMSAAAREHLASQRGSPTIVEHNFYTSLALAARCGGAPTDRRESAVAEIERANGRLRMWAENCPENFRHKWLLVEAELEWLRGRILDAAALYDDAIDSARRQRFVQDEALANERAGRFYREVGRARIACWYLSSAVQAYGRWGATAKVRALEEEFPVLTGRPAPRDQNDPATAGTALDLLSILRAAETIASEIMLDRLLEKLLEVCLTSAGAERGLLFLGGQGKLVLRAGAAVTGPSTVEVLPLACIEEVPTGVVEHLRAGGETLVLADAVHQGAFATDPYVAKHAVRSLMALPIRRKTKLVGVLYLENNLATSVFSSDRVRVLQLLSSQMAISLEIGQLVEKLTAEIEDRKRAEAIAQEAVRLRDEFLSSASHELRTPLTSLQLVIQSLSRGKREGAPPPSVDMLSLATQQIRRLDALVGQLLDVSRVREGTLPLTRESFDMAADVRCILERMQPQIARSRSEVTLHAEKAVVGRWDRSRIDQLFVNLFSNALAFGAGRPVAVRVDQDAASGWARIVVRDRGVGIAPERIGHLFEAYVRATSERHYGGLGLGLLIASCIVGAHHGRLSVESELGRGSSFTAELPPG